MLLIISLMILGLLLAMMEIVLPGGICGVCGAICLLVAVILGFNQSAGLGFGLLVSAVIVGMFAVGLGVRFIPRSPLARQLALEDSARDWQGYDAHNQSLLGKRGISKTDLRPAGVVIIDEERVDVVSEGGRIEANVAVEVIEVEGNRIVVARVEEGSDQST